jgi:hypothetical protein
MRAKNARRVPVKEPPKCRSDRSRRRSSGRLETASSRTGDRETPKFIFAGEQSTRRRMESSSVPTGD